jgi:Uma2 family endonuclease
LLKPRPTGSRRAHASAADVLLLIEVSDSTLQYDLEVKTRLYAQHAVAEYCVVDLVANSVWRHRRPGGQGYAQRDEIREGALELPVNAGEIVVPDLFTP